MNWEELTAPQFARARVECGGVCVLVCGVIEKHGEHLPLGTDMIIGREVARRAALMEPIIIFPPYFFTQIFEARHTAGTIGVDRRVMYDLLEATCDEIARNGLKKIILLNAHGGNEFFLPHFIRLQLERPKDYVVYLPKPRGFPEDDDLKEAVAGVLQYEATEEHAGEMETSMVLATCPNMVDGSVLPNDRGLPLNRLRHLEEAGVYTAIGWYANFPYHYAGRGEYGTAEKGEFILNAQAKRLVEIIRAVKQDEQSLALQNEFFKQIESK